MTAPQSSALQRHVFGLTVTLAGVLFLGTFFLGVYMAGTLYNNLSGYDSPEMWPLIAMGLAFVVPYWVGAIGTLVTAGRSQNTSRIFLTLFAGAVLGLDLFNLSMMGIGDWLNGYTATTGLLAIAILLGAWLPQFARKNTT